VPFGQLELDLVVLPVLPGKKGGAELLDRGSALAKGYPGLARWLRAVEESWDSSKKATTGGTLCQSLDHQSKLSTQRLKSCYKVLYNKSGTHLAACVIDAHEKLGAAGLKAKGFVAEMVTYYYETKDEGEAHYLSAVLNSPLVNDAIKQYQTRGQWGERDITRLPFRVLPIPKYDPDDPLHKELAAISKACHSKVAALVPKMTRGDIGRQRREIRRILKAELAEIDRLVRKLLKGVPVSSRPRHPSGRRASGRSLFHEDASE
jgi:hypothetical protein